ncbi:MAG: hypothetical protein COT74_04865 [Bdellovibrionales bacterium CG10_big_fil_rev_8_21_14_0_10_45_34]|nr:MAG: hypothetical protein COT74_04865 [Bdellovibrionales bacterium CG10_big_fil_rev_8_21_14_0_10_45_34]
MAQSNTLNVVRAISKKQRTTAFVFALSLFWGLIANAYSCKETSAQSLPFEYCYESLGENAHQSHVIYYLHGMGSDARAAFTGSAKPLRDELLQRKDQAMLVGVSLGPRWFLIEKHPTPTGRVNTLQIFAEILLPNIEREMGLASDVKRSIVSESMGGFNAIQLLTYYPKLWQRVSLNCPAIFNLTPFSTQQEVNAYIDRHKPYSNAEKIWEYYHLARYLFESLPEWQRHDPLLLASRLSPLSAKLLVSVGDQDDLGVNEGTLQFYFLAQSTGTRAMLQLLSGGHCVFDWQSIAEFVGAESRARP